MHCPQVLKPTILGFVQFVLCVYAAVSAFAPKPHGLFDRDSVSICPRDTICSEGALELVSLGISRLTAFWMYAPLVLVFLTKCHALRSMLHNSAISVFVPFADEHDFHMKMGKYIAVSSIFHTIFHLIRWGVQHNLHYNWSTVPGRTGWLASFAMLLVIVPMGVQRIKQRLSFEMRKGLHYFCIVAGVCLACHAPKGYIGWVMGACTLVYFLDLMYRKFFMTHKCISPDFVPLGDAVQITFRAPTTHFAASGGFVLVCVPSVNRWQWHPFTTFPSADKPDHWCICVGRAGNWTEAVYKAVETKTVGPIWIQGCFPSSFSTAEDFDNLVLIAAGTGITNALSSIQKLEGGRKLNVIWVCRQASLINYYVPRLARNVQGFTLIYYTGKSKGGEKLIENTFGSHVLFFRKRPDYMKAISSIVIGTETGKWIPDKQQEFADEFYRLVSPHASWDIGYIDVFHLMRLVFNRDNAADNKLDRSAIERLYRAMTPEEQHTDANMSAFLASFEWDEDGAVNMDKFTRGMRRFSNEENRADARALPPLREVLPGDNCNLSFISGTSEEWSVEMAENNALLDAGDFNFRPANSADSSHHISRTPSGDTALQGSSGRRPRAGVPHAPAEVGVQSGSKHKLPPALSADPIIASPDHPAPAALPEGIDSNFCFADAPSQTSGVFPPGSSSSKRLLGPVDSAPAAPEPAPAAPVWEGNISAGESGRLAVPVPAVGGFSRVPSDDYVGDTAASLEAAKQTQQERRRRWSVTDMGEAGEGGAMGRRSSVVDAVAALGRRVSNAGRRMSNAGRRLSDALLRSTEEVPAGRPVLPPAPESTGSELTSGSVSFKKKALRAGGKGWATSGDVFGSGRSSGTAISANGSLNGRAFPPRNWGSFKHKTQQQSFNLKKTLNRVGTLRHNERSERLQKCVEYVNAVDGTAALEDAAPENLTRWEVLYCGGASKTVTDLLTEVTTFLGVRLMTEQFNW